MVNDEVEYYESYQANNQQYATNSAIAERIEVEPILEKIDLFLSGSEIVPVQQKDSSWVMMKKKMVESPVNGKGRYFLMAKMRSLVNRANVQGNFEPGHYEEYMCDIHKSIGRSISINRHSWGITLENYAFIVDFIIQSCEPFFTRLKNDKERGHFDSTVRMHESSRVENTPSSWKLGFSQPKNGGF